VIFILLGAVFVTGYLGISNVNSNSQLLISQVQSQTLQPTFYAAVANINQAKSSAQFWMIIMVSAAGFISVAICIFASISLTKGLKTVRLALDKMAKGDLTQTLTLQTEDESGKMAIAYREMQIYLINMFHQLKSDAEQLNTAGQHLSISASQSSETTKQVAVSSHSWRTRTGFCSCFG